MSYAEFGNFANATNAGNLAAIENDTLRFFDNASGASGSTRSAWTNVQRHFGFNNGEVVLGDGVNRHASYFRNNSNGGMGHEANEALNGVLEEYGQKPPKEIGSKPTVEGEVSKADLRRGREGHRSVNDAARELRNFKQEFDREMTRWEQAITRTSDNANREIERQIARTRTWNANSVLNITINGERIAVAGSDAAAVAAGVPTGTAHIAANANEAHVEFRAQTNRAITSLTSSRRALLENVQRTTYGNITRGAESLGEVANDIREATNLKNHQDRGPQAKAKADAAKAVAETENKTLAAAEHQHPVQQDPAKGKFGFARVASAAVGITAGYSAIKDFQEKGMDAWAAIKGLVSVGALSHAAGLIGKAR